MSDSDPQTAMSHGAGAVWTAVRRGAVSVGRSVAGAYRSVDPDVRRHAFQLPLVGLSLLVPRPRHIEPLPADGFRPLVFVHGLGGHPGNFFALKTYFAARGRTRGYVVDFGNASSFEVMAGHLRDVLDEVVARNALDPGATVDIVAHSMGGLIARFVLEDPEYRVRIANLVTLGTPHVGSHLARLASTELTLALRPGSEILRMLERQEFWGTADAPLLTAFWSRADTVVLPAESAQFERGRTVEVAGVTHYGYLIQPSVWREVFAALLT